MSKAVIMTVDDEPEVLGAIERDLRQRFRSEYRIVKARSGDQALEAARTLKERESPVALFLADERMPRMSGTEFLQEARGLFPDARKVLLTAYADTRAAISGINDIGLDYYLMKPWDPPEQNLYPVLEELLADWAASYRPPFHGIRVLGTSWSPESHVVKDFLSRNQTPYQWVDLELETELTERVEELSRGLRELPVVLFPEGDALVAPTTLELGERIGFHVQADRPFYDMIIVGGGPSGLAAAVYGASEGLRTVLFEDDAPGGQAGTSSRIENYLGFPAGIGGADLARRAATQAQRFGAELVTPQTVRSVRLEDPYRIVTLADGSELSCYALLVASGMAVRRLEVEGIDDFTGAGVYYGAALSEAGACRNAEVVVVGGANSAGQAAMLLSRYADKVRMVVRGPSLSSSMSRYLIDRIEAQENLEVLTNCRIVGVDGDKRLRSVTVHDSEDDRTWSMDTSHVFIFIGSMPRSDVVADLVQTNPGGFILTGPDLLRDGERPEGWPLARDPFLLESSVPGIFAVGDVRAGSQKRVASAVGEGSSAVGMIHKYLESV